MAGLEPATHVFLEPHRQEDVGPRLKAGDDAEGVVAGMTKRVVNGRNTSTVLAIVLRRHGRA